MSHKPTWGESARRAGRPFWQEPKGLHRNRLPYKYPKPECSQDMKVWRHPDHLLPPILPPAAPPHDQLFTRLCFDDAHVKIITKAGIEAKLHPETPTERHIDSHLCYKRKHVHPYSRARFPLPIPWELPAAPIDNSVTRLCYYHQHKDHVNNNSDVPYPPQTSPKYL